MAKKRELKKDIDFLVNEVISDCYTYLYLNGNKKQDQVITLMNEVVEKRNELIHRVNHSDKKADRKQNREYFRTVFNDLLSMVDLSFSKLSDLTKA
ncbi:MAG: hypothetical protein JW783_08665 [Bacteroidales bacterium]|nr:hypothetical protein [Bacteroidales bacterium]MBN2748885.1 hypothetical protein [Bacteroidales bacterium]